MGMLMVSAGSTATSCNTEMDINIMVSSSPKDWWVLPILSTSEDVGFLRGIVIKMQNEIQIDIEGFSPDAVTLPKTASQANLGPEYNPDPVVTPHLSDYASATSDSEEKIKLELERTRTDLFAECSRIVDGIETQKPESEHKRDFLQYRFSQNGVVEHKDTDPFDSSWFVMPNPDPENLLSTSSGRKLKNALEQVSDGRISQERMSRLMSQSLASLFRDAATLGAEGCTQADLSGKTFEQDIAPMLINGIMSDDIIGRIADQAYIEHALDRDKKRKEGAKLEDLPSDEDLLALSRRDADDINKMIHCMSDMITGTGDPNDKAAAQALYRNIMQDSAFGVYASMMEKYDPEQLKKAAESWKKYMQQYTNEMKGNANRLTSPDDMLSLAMIVNAGNPVMLALYLLPILVPALLSGLSKWRELRNNKHLDETTALLSQRSNALTSIEMMGVMSDSMSRSLSCGEDPTVVMKGIMEKLPELRRHYAELVKQNFNIAVKYPEGKKLSNDEKNTIEQTISSKMAQMERVCEAVGKTVDVSCIVAAVDKAHRLFFSGGTWHTAIDNTSMARLEKDLREAALKAGAVPDPKNPSILAQPGKPTREYTEYQTFLERRDRSQKSLEEIRIGLTTPGAVLKRPVSLETIRILSDGLSTMTDEKDASSIGTLLASALLEDASARKIDAITANGESELEIKREIACSLAAEIMRETRKNENNGVSEKDNILSDVGFARGIALTALLKDEKIMDGMGEMARGVNGKVMEDAKKMCEKTVKYHEKQKQNDENYKVFTKTFAGAILRSTMSADLQRAKIAPRMRDVDTVKRVTNITRYLNNKTQSLDSDEDDNKKTDARRQNDGYYGGVSRIYGAAGTTFKARLYKEARSEDNIKNFATVENRFISEEQAAAKAQKRVAQTGQQIGNGFFER